MDSTTTLKLVAVGVFYCTVHNGVLNEDDSACDFAMECDVECNRNLLFYMKSDES